MTKSATFHNNHQGQRTVTNRLNKTVLMLLLLGTAGCMLLPWYVQEDGFWSFEWLLDGYPFDSDYAPAAILLAQGENSGYGR